MLTEALESTMELNANPDSQTQSSFKHCPAGLECGPVRASQGGAVEKIVAAGGRETNYSPSGFTASQKVEIYDITSDTWETGGKYSQHLCAVISKTKE